MPPSKKPAADSSAKGEELAASAVMGATAKLTASLKRRLGNGDEIFFAPGVEIHCTEDELDAKQAEITERVTAWMETLTEKFPDPTDADDDADDDVDDDSGDDDDDDDEGGDEEADEDEDTLTEDEVNAMSLTDLKKLVKEQELDIDLKGMKVKDAREAVIEALFSEDDDEDEDGGDDDDDDDDGEGEGDEDGGAYEEDELKAMKLEDLQEICKDWDIGDPKGIKKAKDLKAKKAAYIKHILESQDEEDEE